MVLFIPSLDVQVNSLPYSFIFNPQSLLHLQSLTLVTLSKITPYPLLVGQTLRGYNTKTRVAGGFPPSLRRTPKHSVPLYGFTVPYLRMKETLNKSRETSHPDINYKFSLLEYQLASI